MYCVSLHIGVCSSMHAFIYVNKVVKSVLCIIVTANIQPETELKSVV